MAKPKATRDPKREPEHETSRRVPTALRRAIEARDGGRCVYCRKAGDMTMDHVKAWTRGGETVAENLVCACSKCNETKAAWPVDMFAQLLERDGKGLAATILQRVFRQLSRPLPKVLPMPAPVYSRSIALSDTRGLDPKRFRVTVIVDREDGEPLTKEDRDAIEAAFASETAPAAVPTPKRLSRLGGLDVKTSTKAIKAALEKVTRKGKAKAASEKRAQASTSR